MVPLFLYFLTMSQIFRRVSSALPGYEHNTVRHSWRWPIQRGKIRSQRLSASMPIHLIMYNLFLLPSTVNFSPQTCFKNWAKCTCSTCATCHDPAQLDASSQATCGKLLLEMRAIGTVSQDLHLQVPPNVPLAAGQAEALSPLLVTENAYSIPKMKH